MTVLNMIYEPREDSFLLQEQVKRHARGTVLDVGTGSGIQAETAAKSKRVKRVVAVDVQKNVIEHCKKKIKNKKIKFLVSDLFSNVRGRFDTIIFNPPYLPEDVRVKDVTLTGGKKGYETIERFFSGANEFLNENGRILIVFSSLTKKVRVDEIIKNYGFEFSELKQKQIFFEVLYVYLVWKNDSLKILNKRKIKHTKKLAKGHRGVIYVGTLNGKMVAVKFQRKDIAAKGTVDNEARVLNLLNKHRIGPKLLFSGKDYFGYGFIDGDFLGKFIEAASGSKIKKVLLDVFNQCRLLDELKINKEEMHHPYKNIIVTKKLVPVLIDFERAKPTRTPKNVTQFCQYVMSLSKLLNKKGFRIDRNKLIELAKEYRKESSDERFEKIVETIS